VNLIEAMADRNLFARWFRDKKTWAAWRAFVAALFALRMTEEQTAIYRECTGRTAPPTSPASEAWLVCGRRAGKSFMLALCAVFLACFHEHRRHLAPGERGTVLVIATNSRQARVIFRYVRALLTRVPMLAKMIDRERADSFDLRNGSTIEVHPASMRTTRGYTIVAALCDEIAFWPHEDAAEPDYEVLNALRPGMATIPGAMLLCASSPYARRGALWDAHRRHFAKDGDPVLVWQAPTRRMNPTVPQRLIDQAMEADPASAAAEWLAGFRTDVEGWVSREALEACVSWDVRERPPVGDLYYYHAFVDPSGGSSDSFTLAIAHREGDVVIVDAVRERRPPFSPEDVVGEFARLLKSYNVSVVVGDRYGGDWPRERFREHGVAYEPSGKSKSDLYRDLLPAINSRRLDLLDEPRLLAQLAGLERRTARGGRDSVDHAPGAHDDLANAVAGAAASVIGGSSLDCYNRMDWVMGPGVDAPAAASARAAWQQDGIHSVDLCRPFSAFGALGPASPWRSSYWK
jgi:hypothetical protein